MRDTSGDPASDSPASSNKMFDTSLRLGAPGPGGLPLLNNVRFMMDPGSYTLDRLAGRPGPVLPVTGGNGSIIVIRGTEAIRQVFTDNDTFQRLSDGVFRLPPGRRYSKMFTSVITANGAEHRRARKLLMPTMHRSALEHYRTTFEATFEGSRFARSEGPEPFDLVAEFLKITKTNMMVCLLGLVPDADGLALADDTTDLLSALVDPRVFLFQREIPRSPYARFVAKVASVYDRFGALIERRRAEPPAPDALSILCHTTGEDGDHLTTEEIAGELNGLFAAGFETSAMSMTWAALTILGDPRLRADLREGDPALLDAVVKESQRLLPTVPLSLPRRVTRDVGIGPVAVPKGAALFTNAVLEHRDPDVYPDPDAFRPARWLEPGFAPSPYEFLPFGVGARRCLGASFADLQIRVTLGLLCTRGPLLEPVTTKVDYRTRAATALPGGPIMVREGVPREVEFSGSVSRLWRV